MTLQEKLIDIQVRVNAVEEGNRGQSWLAAKNALEAAEEMVSVGFEDLAEAAVVEAQTVIARAEERKFGTIDEQVMLERLRLSDPEAYTWVAWAQEIISCSYELSNELTNWTRNDLVSVNQDRAIFSCERDPEDVWDEFQSLMNAIESGNPVGQEEDE